MNKSSHFQQYVSNSVSVCSLIEGKWKTWTQGIDECYIINLYRVHFVTKLATLVVIVFLLLQRRRCKYVTAMRSWPRLLFEIIEVRALEKALAEHLERKTWYWYIMYIASISISTITINITSRGVEFNLNRIKYCKRFFISWKYYIIIGMLAIMVKAREIVWPKDKKYKLTLLKSEVPI